MLGARLSANERAVLDVVWRNGPIARQDIAQATNLTAASVTRLTQRLDREGLILSGVEKTGTRGKQPQPVYIDPDGGWSFGVSFSHTFMDVGLVNLAGEIQASIREPLERADVDEIAAKGSKAVCDLARRIGIDPSRVFGVGFALPGDFANEPPYLNAHAYFPALRGQDIHKAIQAQLEFDCYLENDCNAAALGERVLGHGRTHGSVIAVFLGHGIGSGLIVNGHPVRGAHGNAGAIGYVYPMDQPRPSGQDLFEAMDSAGLNVRDFNHLEAFEADPPEPLKAWIKRAGKQLCYGLSIAARLIDPDAIVVGGRAPTWLLRSLVEAIDYDAFCAAGAPLAKPPILASDLGGEACVIGAAAVPIYRTLFDQAQESRKSNYANGRR